MLGEDAGLLTYFLDHYKKMGVEKFHIVIHAKNHKSPVFNDAVKILNTYNIVPERVFRGVWNGAVYTNILNSVKDKYPNDWFVVADQDEFQTYPDTLQNIVSDNERNGKDFVTGCLLDRVAKDGDLNSIDGGGSLWEQYPVCGFFSFPIARSNPYKITLSKGNIKLSEGQHGVIIPQDSYPVTNEIIAKVHHFKWNKNLMCRVSNRLERERKGEWKNSYGGYKNELQKLLNYFNTGRRIDMNDKLFMFQNIGKEDKYIYWDYIKSLLSDWDTLHRYPTITSNFKVWSR
jgi:hypothetical protein